jgi:hypothetical protein
MGWMRGTAWIALVMLGGPSFAAAAGQKVPGYYNPKTHAFTPAPQATTAAAPIVRSGKLTINVKALLDAISTKEPVYAYIDAYLDDTNYQNALGSEVTMKRTGNTATASLTIPYIFTAMNASEQITVSVQVVTQTAPYPSTLLTAKIPLPANNAVTVVNLPQTL